MLLQLLALLLGLTFPRFLAAVLWWFTDWFTGVFETQLWPLLGFFFLPTTMLWYSAVQHWYGGEWNWWQIALLVGAILTDAGRNGYTVKKTRQPWHRA